MATTQMILEGVAEFLGREHGLQIGGEEVEARGGERFDAAIPYGGFKLSGSGKELGREALELYLRTKTVWVDLS